MGRTACNLHSKLGGDDTATARWTASWRRPGLRLATRSSHPATLIQASTGSAVLLTAKAKVLRALSRVHDILGSKLRLDSTWPRARSSAAGSAPQQRALRAQTIPSSVPVHVVARMGGADSACRNFSTAASPPRLKPPSKQERRRFTDSAYATCWIRVSSITRRVQGTKRWRWSVTRAPGRSQCVRRVLCGGPPRWRAQVGAGCAAAG